MDPNERDERRERDAGELFRAIGQFVVTFEHSCHAIQVCIMFLLEGAGLKKQRASQVILAGMTADPLRTLLESLLGELVPLNDHERKVVKDAVTRFQKLTQNRNDIIHSTWYIGWGNEITTEFKEASGHKYHKNKNGVVIRSFRKEAADFAALTEEAQALAYIFQRLNGCLVFGHSIEKTFVVSPTGHVSVPPGTAS